MAAPIYPQETIDMEHTILNKQILYNSGNYRSACITKEYIDLDKDGTSDVELTGNVWYSSGGGTGSNVKISSINNAFITRTMWYESTYMYFDTVVTGIDTTYIKNYTSDSTKGKYVSGPDKRVKLLKVELNQDISKLHDWGNELMDVYLYAMGGSYSFMDATGDTYLGVMILKNNYPKYGWIKFSGNFLVDCAVQK